MRLNRSKLFLLTAVLGLAPTPFFAGQLAPKEDCKQPASLPSDQEIAGRITATELQRVANLHDYSVIRKYNLQNSRLKKTVVMTVRLSYIKGQGKSFEILDLQNAEGMSRKVLERLVESEAETSREKRHDDLSISKDNYRFHVTGTGSWEGHRCYLVDLIPKRKSKYLVQGKAWVDTREFALVRIEGHPSASLSFWVGKPYIVQDFQKVGLFWMASHNRSESQSFVLGTSVLTIDYSQYQVNPETSVAQNLAGSPKSGTLE